VCGFDRGITVKDERYMSRDEYCGTCHGKIYKLKYLHSKHPPDVALECVDCHPPFTNRSGERYSIHDHRFDFSGPELPCTECHEADDKRLMQKPQHAYRFTTVRGREVRTVEEACARCHKGGAGKPDLLKAWEKKVPAAK
jgi:nitrate/TMAO reductase-like tetraheme cytochrome c subunit